MQWTTLAVLALVGLGLAQDSVSAPPPPFRRGLPDASVAGKRRVLVLEGPIGKRGTLDVLASVRPSTQKIVLQWESSGPGRRKLGGAVTEIGFDGIPLSVASLASGGLVVAGEGRGASSRRMRLERIDLAPAEIGEAGRLSPGEPVARTTLWESATTGERVIAHLARWPGAGRPRLIALMWDTPEVLAFDVDAAAFSRLAALETHGEPGVLEVPELARTYCGLDVREHPEHGVLVVLRTATVDDLGDEDRALVLVDGDRDGILDRSMLLDAEGWRREGISDAQGTEDFGPEIAEPAFGVAR